ncbi:MAG TPA: NCS2 family permease [Gemmatimonadaceae bacterium]|nr:NCS2 family permease [Gemmatimonadaceae bacterium]
MIQRFHLRSRGSTVPAEIRGAVTTFLTMAYILFANPAILSAAGVPPGPAVAATAGAAAICSIMMGVVANFPLALASGMGLNAIIAYQIAPIAGSWQTAMGLVVLDGLLALLLVLAGFREAVMNAIPRDLRRAIGVGIGLFLAFIGLVNARLVVVPPGTVGALAGNPLGVMPPVTYGSLRSAEATVALVGVLITAALLARRVTGALVLGIIASTVLALALGAASLPAGAWVSLPSFATVGQADVIGALAPSVLPLVLPLLIVDFFDTIGTVTAVAEEAGLHGDGGRIPGIRRVLAVDSLSAAVGGFFGASSVTSYVESAAGVAEGARTGLHSVVVGLLFTAALFLTPVLGIVPSAATAPALIAVGFLMCRQVARIDFRDLDTAIPAFVLLVTIPFTYSISHGIGYGFITFVVIKVLSAKWRDVHPLMYATAAGFGAYFAFG